MKHRTKLNVLRQEQIRSLDLLLYSKGKASTYTSAKVLFVHQEDLQYNLSGGRYLTQVSATELMDNSGYHYDHSVLNVEQWADLLDYFETI